MFGGRRSSLFVFAQLFEYREIFQRSHIAGHAAAGGEFTQQLGLELAKRVDSSPDYIVTVLGAGSTIEGQAIPIKRWFRNEPKIIVPEHFQSQLT